MFSLRQTQHPIPFSRYAYSLGDCTGSDAGIGLASVHGFAYLVSVSIGDQPLELILDTGSSDLWALSTNCTSPECEGPSKYSNTPSLELSSTPFDLKYLQGSVSGTVGTETVAIGPYAVSEQTLAFANEVDNLGVSATGNSGIIGLAFASTSGISPAIGTTFLDNLFASLDDDHRFFALNLARDGMSSSLSVGLLDPMLASSIDSFSSFPVWIGPSSSPDYWKIPLRSISLNGTVIFSSFAPSRVQYSSKPIAILDSGTTFILGPSSDVDAFWNAAGGSRKNTDGTWEVRCSRAIVVGFTFGDGNDGREYVVDPSDVSWHSAGDDGWCTGGIQSNNNVKAGDWILGNTFLRNVYVLHHGGTSRSSPSIGLLNLTDRAAAVARFRRERGEDEISPINPGTQVVSLHASKAPLGFILTCGMVALGSYLLGGVSGWITLVWKGRIHRPSSIVSRR